MKWRSLQETRSSSETRSLREIFAECKAAIARYAPADVQAIHERTVTNLKAQRFATNTLSAGASSPAFELPDHNGEIVSSVALLAKGPLVLFFIRGRWCPFCVAQTEAMSSITAEIISAGATLVAISPQTQRHSYFMYDQHELAFPLLVDANNRVARQFGLVYVVSEEEQMLYRRTFVNLPSANGDSSWELPIPATFVIDRHGTILFASTKEDYTDRPEPFDILSTIRSIK
jgi:peroxiredoxin